MTSNPAPRGRPPAGHVWNGKRFVEVSTGETFCPTRHKQQTRHRRRQYERAKYWDLPTKIRMKRLERAARESGRDCRPMQLKLEQICAVSTAVLSQDAECVQMPEKAAGTTINRTDTSKQLGSKASREFGEHVFFHAGTAMRDCTNEETQVPDLCGEAR